MPRPLLCAGMKTRLAVRMAGLPLLIAGRALITAEDPPKPVAYPTISLPKEIGPLAFPLFRCKTIEYLGGKRHHKDVTAIRLSCDAMGLSLIPFH